MISELCSLILKLLREEVQNLSVVYCISGRLSENADDKTLLWRFAKAVLSWTLASLSEIRSPKLSSLQIT
jgi:hypothetical protein